MRINPPKEKKFKWTYEEKDFVANEKSKTSIIRISTKYPWSEDIWEYMTSDDTIGFFENKLFYSVKK